MEDVPISVVAAVVKANSRYKVLAVRPADVGAGDDPEYVYVILELPVAGRKLDYPIALSRARMREALDHTPFITEQLNIAATDMDGWVKSGLNPAAMPKWG